MSLPEFAQISEENELLRDQLRDLETLLNEARSLINELKAMINAKEEGATVHRELAQFDGAVWSRDVTVIAPEWERVREA
jgi:predicted component of type VI protein secretion system